MIKRSTRTFNFRFKWHSSDILRLLVHCSHPRAEKDFFITKWHNSPLSRDVMCLLLERSGKTFICSNESFSDSLWWLVHYNHPGTKKETTYKNISMTILLRKHNILTFRGSHFIILFVLKPSVQAFSDMLNMFSTIKCQKTLLS